MKYYCIRVGTQYYKGFQGEKGFLVKGINQATILEENRNYKGLLEDAKKYYKEAVLMEVIITEKVCG
jgi:hypothetical protein